MSQRLRAPALPEGLTLSFNVRVMPVGDWAEPVTLETAEKRGRFLQRTNIVIVGRARAELRELFTPEEPQVGKFLGSLLRTNFVVDAELTREARAKRTDSFWAADRYESGQLIAQRGQVIVFDKDTVE